MRSTRLALVCLALFLALLPLVLPRPGLPPSLKSDEAPYYVMALSLWNDGDIRCEDKDLERLFREYSGPVGGIRVSSEDGWQTTLFSKPFVYPLIVAPIAGLFGANGMVSLNLLLLVGMVWMGTSYLETANSTAIAALFAAGFVFLSPAFPYAFWVQPEIFNMAAVMAACYLVFRSSSSDRSQNLVGRWLDSRWVGPIGSAALLSLAAYNKPMLIAFALPLIYAAARKWDWRSAGIWLLTLLVAMAVLVGVAVLLSGHPWPYIGADRESVAVSSPIQYAERELQGRPRDPSLWVLKRPPDVNPHRLLEDLKYFAVGRHVGVVPYMPFAILCFGLFLLHGRRSRLRWLLFASLCLVALLQVVSLPGSWHGGRGFLGNRYYSNAYPAFLFLVTTIRPLALLPLGYGLAGLLLGPVLLYPFGPPVKAPDQLHVRQAIQRRLPLELSLLDWIPNYAWANYPGQVKFLGRRDLLRVEGQEMWLLGASSSDLWITSPTELQDAVFLVRNVAVGNRIEICLEGDCWRQDFDTELANAAPELVTLRPEGPRSVRRSVEPREYVYRLSIETSSGEQPRWRGRGSSTFYLGAALEFLGTSADLGAGQFEAEWLDARVAAEIPAGQTMRVPVRLRNRGEIRWRARGATPVKAAYHWLDSAGERAVWEGRRTELPSAVEPGAIVELTLPVTAPGAPGEYALVLDLVREQVGWFSARRPESSHRVEVEVVEPDAEP